MLEFAGICYQECPKVCATCKFWEKDKKALWVAQNLQFPLDPDTLEPMEMPWEVKRCTSPELLVLERPVAPYQAALCDGSEYYAELVSGPLFGCRNWEPRDDDGEEYPNG